MKKPIHILQLEENQNDTLRVQLMLEQEGYACDMVRVSTRSDFVASLTNDRFDLILSAMGLSAIDGLEALALARELAPDAPFIIVSGTIGEETAIECLLNGATDYVLKKNMARLVPAVRRALNDSSERRERQRAERELKKISTLLEQTADSIVITDTNGVIEYVNPAFEKITGYTRNEALGKTPRILKSGMHSKEFYEMMWQTILSGRVFQAEFHNQKKNGELYYQEETITPVHDLGGVVSHFVSTGRDISERRKAAEALTDSEERFRMLFEFSPDAYYLMDLNGLFIDGNRASEKLFEYRREELVGKNFFKLGLLPFAELSRAAGLVAANTLGKPTGPDEFVLKTKSGKELIIELRTLPMKIGEQPLVVGIARDVTERRKAEMALRESEARYRRLFEDAVLGIFRSHVDGRVIAVNAALASAFGYDSPDDMMTSVRDVGEQLFAEPGRRVEVLRLAEAKAGLNKFEILFKRKDGGLFTGTTYILLDKDANGKVQYVEGMIEDTSERKKAEEAIREHEFWLSESQRVARIGSYVTDFTAGYWKSSDELDMIFGIGKDYDKSVAGWVQLVHPESREEMTRYLADIAARRAPFDKDYQIVRHSDGMTRWVHGLGELVYDSGGNLLTMFGTIQDITERKLAEEALLESEERYKVIANAQFEGIAVHADGRILDVNDSFCALFGYRKEELVGTMFADLLDPEVRDSALDSLRLESDIEHEIVGITAAGTRIIGEVRSRNLSYRGIPVRVTAIRDITERKRAEDVVRTSELRFRSVWEHSSDGMRLTDREGRIIEVNDSFCSLVKIAKERLLGELFSVIYQRGGRDDDISLYLDRFASGKIVPRLQTPVTLWNGEVLELELSNSFIDTGEQGRMILSVFRDITDRKRAERQSALLAHTLRSARDCISVTDRDNNILFVNEAFSTTYGYSEDELLGKDISIVWSSPASPGPSGEVFSSTLMGGWHGELTNRRKDGAEFPVEVWTSVVRDEEGTPVALVGIARDISERVKFEEQLRHVQKMESIGTLAGGIAHDFNNILGIILGHTTLLTHSHNDPERVKYRAEAIDKAVQRGADLVRQILMFARKSIVQPAPVNVNATVTELSRMLKDTFPKTIDIRLDLDGSLPVMMMDPTQLHQALLNLCVNARDAMMEARSSELAFGMLSIQTSIIAGAELRARFADASADRFACIAVSDTGAGIDEATRQKIFEPFFTTKEVGKGTGLGLSVVYAIMQSHQGYVDVASEPGRGTTFKLFIPIPERMSNVQSQEQSTPDEILGGSETILLVEDEEELLSIMQVELERKGYRVLVATDGIEAVDVFTQCEHQIALVMSDIGLPKLDGAGLFSILREFDPKLRFILASGYLDPALKSDLLGAGAKAFIQKPYDPGEVTKVIREALDAPE